MANEDDYLIGIVKDWTSAACGMGYGQLLYMDDVLEDEVNIAFIEKNVSEECRPLLAPKLPLLFTRDQSDLFAENIKKWDEETAKETYSEECFAKMKDNLCKLLGELSNEQEKILQKGIIKEYDGVLGEILFKGEWDGQIINLSAHLSANALTIMGTELKTGDFVSFRRTKESLVASDVLKLADLRLLNAGEREFLENSLTEASATN